MLKITDMSAKDSLSYFQDGNNYWANAKLNRQGI